MNKYARECDVKKLFERFAGENKKCTLENDTLTGQSWHTVFGFCFENASFEKQTVILCGMEKKADKWEITVVGAEDKNENEHTYTVDGIKAFFIPQDIRISPEFDPSGAENSCTVETMLAFIGFYVGEDCLNEKEKELISLVRSEPNPKEHNSLIDEICKDYEPCDPINREKARLLHKVSDETAKALGYDGEFPKYKKNDKYIEFDLGYSCYEDNGVTRYFDYTAFFGNRDKKYSGDPMKRPFFPTDCLQLENEEQMKCLFVGMDAAAEGRKPADEFFALPSVADSLPSDKPQKILAWFLGVLGALLSVVGVLAYFLGFGEGSLSHSPYLFIPMILGLALIAGAVFVKIRSEKTIYN